MLWIGVHMQKHREFVDHLRLCEVAMTLVYGALLKWGYVRWCWESGWISSKLERSAWKFTNHDNLKNGYNLSMVVLFEREIWKMFWWLQMVDKRV